MPSRLTQSLIFRAGVAMAGITILAIASMLTSVIIAETARGDAAAINIAGSLRMQSYRLATALLQQAPGDGQVQAVAREFDQRLRDPALTGVIPEAAGHPLRRQYARVIERWRERMEPAALAGPAGQQALGPADYVAQVDGFVEDVDQMVQLVQQEAEAKIQLLRLLQGAALFLTLALLFFTMFKLLTDVVPPLRELFFVVEEARRGNFSARATYRGRDEIGLLANTFNLMAADLSRMYADLERRVEEKTQALTRSNKALTLLYQTARGLSQERDRADFERILGQVEQVIGVGPLTLCLSTSEARRAYQRITTAEERPGFCRAPECATCLRGTRPGEVSRPQEGVLSVPVMDSGQNYGAILIQHPPAEPLQPWQRELVETVGDHIATALQLTQQQEQQRRLALMDERAVIARELHDSLAQSLSYLKIQVSRLQAQLDKDGDPEKLRAVIAELREGLSSAYRQLRELLSTFRLQMNEAGLEAALRQTAEEFCKRGDIDVRLDFRLGHCPLSPNEEIHVLQVVREALANVIHHAHAGHAEVELKTTRDGAVSVRVLDDGVGLPENWQRKNHYGTIIMQERAESLDGDLDLRRRPAGGTEVRLSFMPEVAKNGGSLLASSSAARGLPRSE